MAENQDDGLDDSYASRRTELEQLFHSLSRPGTAEYWSRLERPGEGQVLPLEVVARCLRERYTAGALNDAGRVLELIMRRIQRGMDTWAWRIARQARGSAQLELKEDLEQECLVKLWEELIDDGKTFLLENFEHTLSRLQQHVAHDVMQKAGEWQRAGTTTSVRVPRREIDSLQAEPTHADADAIADRLADRVAERALESADLSDLRDLVTKLPLEQRELILDRFWRGLSQEEMAAERNITSRTVYNRLKLILTQLGIRYAGDEGDGRG